jgi:hypothetical protein
MHKLNILSRSYRTFHDFSRVSLNDRAFWGVFGAYLNRQGLGKIVFDNHLEGIDYTVIYKVTVNAKVFSTGCLDY